MGSIVVCRCGMTIRSLQGKKNRLFIEVDPEGSMVRVHQCRALRMVWSAPSGMRLLGPRPA